MTTPDLNPDSLETIEIEIQSPEPLSPDHPLHGATGHPECLGFEPRGFRDIFWCFIMNEPGIIEYRGKKPRPVCINCSGALTDGNHTYIASIVRRP